MNPIVELEKSGLHLSESNKNSLQEVELFLKEPLKSIETLAPKLFTRLLNSGGKRLRPLLVCLCHQAVLNKNQSKKLSDDKTLKCLAAVAELVHSATLFHDDVLDSSEKRRGIDAAHIYSNNKTAILSGDFVYAEAFRLLMQEAQVNTSKKLAECIKNLVEGEILQSELSQNRELSWESYHKVALNKTAALFSWCTQSGAELAGSTELEAAFNFGESLGLAFQYTDDIIDFHEFLESPQEAMQEWIASPPSLSLMILHDLKEKECQEIWNGLGKIDLQEDLYLKYVQQLKDLYTNSSTLEKSFALTQKILSQSREDLKAFGSSEDLDNTITLLENRVHYLKDLF